MLKNITHQIRHLPGSECRTNKNSLCSELNTLSTFISKQLHSSATTASSPKGEKILQAIFAPKRQLRSKLPFKFPTKLSLRKEKPVYVTRSLYNDTETEEWVCHDKSLPIEFSVKKGPKYTEVTQTKITNQSGPIVSLRGYGIIGERTVVGKLITTSRHYDDGRFTRSVVRKVRKVNKYDDGATFTEERAETCVPDTDPNAPPGALVQTGDLVKERSAPFKLKGDLYDNSCNNFLQISSLEASKIK